MCITNQKLHTYGRKFTTCLHGTWSLLKVLMIFGIKEQFIILSHTMYFLVLLQIYPSDLRLVLCSRVTSISEMLNVDNQRLTQWNTVKQFWKCVFKSNHFYGHITTAHVPWWVKFLIACSRLGVDWLSAPILSIWPIIDIGHFQNRFADNYYYFF